VGTVLQCSSTSPPVRIRSWLMVPLTLAVTGCVAGSNHYRLRRGVFQHRTVAGQRGAARLLYVLLLPHPNLQLSCSPGSDWRVVRALLQLSRPTVPVKATALPTKARRSHVSTLHPPARLGKFTGFLSRAGLMLPTVCCYDNVHACVPVHTSPGTPAQPAPQGRHSPLRARLRVYFVPQVRARVDSCSHGHICG
jgi:hypothetical protein